MLNSPLYPGDTGEMPADARRVLSSLMRGPTLDGERQSKLWPVLLREEARIRSRLHDMFLSLVLDREQQIAFVQQADVAELDAPTLLRKSTLTFRETALLLHLRAELVVADAQGDRCVVEREHLIEHLRAYRSADERDEVKFDDRSDATIERMVTRHGILRKLKGSDTRLEVSQALRILFGVEEIETLTKTYASLRAGDALPVAAANENQDEIVEDTTA